MKLTIYQVDAFADKLFSGNPAAVIPLDKWIDDSLMQQIAEENNLAETVFFVPQEDGFHIRWFTPEPGWHPLRRVRLQRPLGSHRFARCMPGGDAVAWKPCQRWVR